MSVCGACNSVIDPADSCARYFENKAWCGLCSVKGDPNPVILWLYLNAKRPDNAVVDNPPPE